MAFVLVQHLSPKHKSILPDIIQGYTHMKVFQAEDGMTVMPNCIYIIPPNRDLAILNGALHLYEIPEPRSLHLPIDFFSAPLQKINAVGPSVLSYRAPAATGLRGSGRLKVRAVWSLSRNPIPRNMTACLAELWIQVWLILCCPLMRYRVISLNMSRMHSANKKQL